MNDELKALLQALVDGKVLQYVGYSGAAVDLSLEGAIRNISNHLYGSDNPPLRIKPATIMINGIEVPAPESAVPEFGQYFVIEAAYPQGYSESSWSCDFVDANRLKRGQIWLKESDIKQVVKAMGWAE